MSDMPNATNPYEAYFHAMMEMQMEMSKSYMANAQNRDPNGQVPPMVPPHMHPAHFNPFIHPHMGHQSPQGMMSPPPHWGHPPMPQQQPQQPTSQNEDGNNALFEQAQSMLEGALGEDAGMFKEILGTFGMSDKEFWKGAMVGAAAALLLSNENVRGKLMGVVSGAGDMLKSGGTSVKDSAMTTASSVKENVTTSGEIFRDTVSAGKQGFQESVEKHKTEPETKALKESETADSEVEPEAKPIIKEQ